MPVSVISGAVSSTSATRPADADARDDCAISWPESRSGTMSMRMYVLNATSWPTSIWPSIARWPPYQRMATSESAGSRSSSGMKFDRNFADARARSSTVSARRSRRRVWRRSMPKPLTTRIPATLSSTTPESSPSSCWSANVCGPILCENRTASAVRMGSVPRARSASNGLASTMMMATPVRVNRLDSVSGTNVSIWLIWSRSVLAREISCPVCASSWNAKWSRCRCANCRSRRSVSTR